MNRTHTNAAVAWLRPIAGGSAEDLHAVPWESWENVIAAAAKGGVLEALIVRLRESGLMAALPHALWRQLERVEHHAALAALGNQRTFVQLARVLVAADVPVVPYKGIDLAHTVYPDMRMRPMTDVDLWVRAEELPAALDALATAGLVFKPSPTRQALYPRAWDGEVKLRRRDDDHTAAELHHGPYPGEWLHRAARIDRAATWDRLQAGALLGHPVLRLAPEDHALEVALHATINHQFSYVPLRQLLDLVMLARAGLDTEKLAARARVWRITRPVRLAFALASEAYEEPSTTLIAERLALEDPRINPLRTWGLPTLSDILEARRLSRTRLARYVYFLQLTHGWADATRLLVPGVWPERSWLVARYGSAGPQARLRHLRVLLSRDRRGGRA